MGFYGAKTDEELIRNFLCGMFLDDELQNLLFALGKVVLGFLGCTGMQDILDKNLRKLRVKVRVADSGIGNCLLDMFDSTVG